MSDVLTRICDDKRADLKRRATMRPFAAVDDAARAAAPPRPFAAALQARVSAGDYGLIAEIKKASPSRGLIREDFNPPGLARAYRDGGATCLSVLTDEPYFQGRDEYIETVRMAVDLPVLRKDFMVDPYQIAESRAIGADCILLILAALTDTEAAELEAAAFAYGMDVLVEVHDEQELDRSIKLQSPLIGINNRDLKTLGTDIATTERLAPRVPAGRLLVCESGLDTPQDLARMAAAGAYCFLVATSLMEKPDVAAATRALLLPPDGRRQRA